MSDLNNFKLMLSHGFPSNNIYIEIISEKYVTIEKKIVSIQMLGEVISYEQWNFEKSSGEFINRQHSTVSHAERNCRR